MTRFSIALIAVFFIISLGCQKNKEMGEEVSIAKKYAKYRVSVYKEKELKTWMATLEKAEDVSLLSEESYTDNKGRSKEISKIKLADDSVGYIESRHLADTPIVFTTNTKAFVRPTSGSRIFATIPKGELGFIIGEKGLWVQIYVGKIKDKNVTQQWVEGGYISDANVVLEAKQYALALSALEDKDSEKRSNAEKIFEDLSNGSSVIAEMAKEKLIELGKNYDLNTEEPSMKDEDYYNQ